MIFLPLRFLAHRKRVCIHADVKTGFWCLRGLDSGRARVGYGDLPIQPSDVSASSRSQTYSNRSMTSPTNQHTTNNPWNIAAMEEGGSPWDGR
jgi:hypothetical protein